MTLVDLSFWIDVVMLIGAAQELPYIQPRWRRTLRDISLDVNGAAPIAVKDRGFSLASLRDLSKRDAIEWIGRNDNDGWVRITDLGWRVLARFPPPSVGEVVRVVDPVVAPNTDKNLGLVVISSATTLGMDDFVDIFVPDYKSGAIEYPVHVDDVEIFRQAGSEMAEFMIKEYRRWMGDVQYAPTPFADDVSPEQYQDSPVDFSRFEFLDD